MINPEDTENVSHANAEVASYGAAPKIDFTKIKNKTAAKKELGEVVSGIESASRKQHKSKFSFTQEHEIEIPTGGILYKNFDDEDIKNGIVRLRPMSLADEDILANQAYAKNGSTLYRLLNSCMLNNFDAKNFVGYDLYYLIYALRRITYGDDYKFEITCPNCGKKEEVSVNVAELEFEQLKDIPEGEKATYSKVIKLPISKYTVDIKCLTMGDLEEETKLSKRYEDYGDTILLYTVRTNEILDENGDPVNPDYDYPDFYEALPSRDRVEITKAFEAIDNLKIPEFSHTCSKCGNTTYSSIPFDKDFFRY